MKLHHLELVGNVMTYKRDEMEKKAEPLVAELKRLREQSIINDASMNEKIDEVKAGPVYSHDTFSRST